MGTLIKKVRSDSAYLGSKTIKYEIYFSGFPKKACQGCHISEGARRIIFLLMSFNALGSLSMETKVKWLGIAIQELLHSRHFVPYFSYKRDYFIISLKTIHPTTSGNVWVASSISYISMLDIVLLDSLVEPWEILSISSENLQHLKCSQPCGRFTGTDELYR